jgi:hypothetical protein
MKKQPDPITLVDLDDTRAEIAKRWEMYCTERMNMLEAVALYREMKAFDRVLEFYRNPRTAWKEPNEKTT